MLLRRSEPANIRVSTGAVVVVRLREVRDTAGRACTCEVGTKGFADVEDKRQQDPCSFGALLVAWAQR